MSGYAVQPDDRTLIAQSLRGDSSAFGELVHRHQDRLYNTVYRLLDNAEDAQDVVQEAFLNAYQSLRLFKGDAQFFTWLYRIAVNSAISLRRKRRLVLKEIEGLKYEEIAAALQVPIGTVRSRLHRARLELREQLGSSES